MKLKNVLYYFCLVYMMFMCFNAHSKVTVKEALYVFKVLIHKNKIKAILRISKTDDVNASSSNNHIVVIETGMLNFLKNKDELAIVLGHELGHISNGCGDGYDEEFKADMYGARLSHAKGYNVCRGVLFFGRFMHQYGDETNSSHPRWAYRLNRFPGCGY